MRKFSRAATAALFPCLLALATLPGSAYAKYDPTRDYQEIPPLLNSFLHPVSIWGRLPLPQIKKISPVRMS
ncbi:Uncharacterised protein [Leminorella richardii]|uniref:Uncharacterized protein n=1 Tax=Leminorella richardii TaxID=158841 RepID=A0A2X4XTI7_9GAMM|nr:hypothetical protein [Leminorella richardii]SQI43335.1 Uncharacterised protein [Leminorella richardii]